MPTRSQSARGLEAPQIRVSSGPLQPSSQRNSVDNAFRRHSGLHSGRRQQAHSMLSELDTRLQDTAAYDSSLPSSRSFGSTVSSSEVWSMPAVRVSSHAHQQGLLPNQLELPMSGQIKARDMVHLLSEKMTELASQISAEHDKQVRHLMGKLKTCDNNRVSLRAEVDKLREGLESANTGLFARRSVSDTPDGFRQASGTDSHIGGSMPLAICLSTSSAPREHAQAPGTFFSNIKTKLPWKNRQIAKQEHVVSPFDGIVTDESNPEQNSKSAHAHHNKRSMNSLTVPAPQSSRSLPPMSSKIVLSKSSASTSQPLGTPSVSKADDAGDSLTNSPSGRFVMTPILSESLVSPQSGSSAEACSESPGQLSERQSDDSPKTEPDSSKPDDCRVDVSAAQGATLAGSANGSSPIQPCQGSSACESADVEVPEEKGEPPVQTDSTSTAEAAKEPPQTATNSGRSRAVAFFGEDPEVSMGMEDGKNCGDASQSMELAERTNGVRFAAEEPRTSTDSSEHVFRILEVWTEPKQESHAAKLLRGAAMIGTKHFMQSTSHASMASLDEESSEDEKEVVKKKKRCSCNVVIMPNSAGRMWWDILAAILVYYDCIAIPLQFLELGDNDPINVMTWTTRIFWSIDLPLSCITGYVAHDGRTVASLWNVVSHYFRTWFFIDSLMVVIDWAQVVAGGFGGINAARMTKTLKSLRLVRVMRLWKLHRTKRLPEWLQAIVDAYFSSEVSHIFMGIVKIIIFLIWINHTVACLWYNLAKEQLDEQANWLSEHHLQHSSDGYKYATAFHWSLTQFTGAMEVVPHNLSERLYAVCVLLLAFILAAIVVSSITSSMTRFEIATAQESRRLSVLKQYLFDNRISNKLALRVQRNAQYAWMDQKRSTPESQIELLELISDPLRMELHYEINMRVFSVHPFFKQYSIINPQTCKQVCHLAVSMLKLSRDDLLFDVGEVAQVPRMYFVTKGKLTYHPRHGSQKKISVDNWACEPALWTQWVHCGTLRARAESSLLVLLTEKFQDLANQSQGFITYPRKYGNAFVRCLNYCNAMELTDLEDPEMELRWLAKKAAAEDGETVRSSARYPTGVGDFAFSSSNKDSDPHGPSRLGLLRTQMTTKFENFIGGRGSNHRNKSEVSADLREIQEEKEEEKKVGHTVRSSSASTQEFSRNISCR